ncbi:MAG: hypothetical protein AB8H86_31635 [Polyangiales bacterium]
MQSEPSTVAYDHIDAILFALGFVAGIALGSAFDLSPEVGAALALVPSTVRRKVFGAPRLPPPRSGALWSLASIFGLFSVIAGVGLFWASSVALSRMLESTTDPVLASIERDHTSDFLWTLCFGVGFVALGAFLTWARYPQADDSLERPRV